MYTYTLHVGMVLILQLIDREIARNYLRSCTACRWASWGLGRDPHTEDEDCSRMKICVLELDLGIREAC